MGELKRRIIEAMEPTEYELARRWIPVEERLPEKGVDVLVASPCPNSSTPNIDIASWGSEGEQEPVWRESDCGRIYPTNWMPLPEPPEVK